MKCENELILVLSQPNEKIILSSEQYDCRDD